MELRAQQSLNEAVNLITESKAEAKKIEDIMWDGRDNTAYKFFGKEKPGKLIPPRQLIIVRITYQMYVIAMDVKKGKNYDLSGEINTEMLDVVLPQLQKFLGVKLSKATVNHHSVPSNLSYLGTMADDSKRKGPRAKGFM